MAPADKYAASLSSAVLDAPEGDTVLLYRGGPKPVADKLAAYLNILKCEDDLYGERPKVEVKCDFSYTLELPASKVDRDIVTVPEVFAGAAVAPFKAAAKAVGILPKEEGKNAIQQFPVLQDVQCVFRPGEITLVLAPPGHGKTALLKAVAGALPKNAIPDKGVTYGGLTAAELEEKNISVNRMCAYVEQVDTHLPFLTVHETAKFSHDNSTPAPADTDEAKYLHEGKLKAVTQLLALEGCIDTIIGDDLVRGVSGGEKKRVTIAETLVTNARVFCMDEISTGLDAAVTFNIVAALRAWARTTNGTAIVALLQPTPEVFEQFDELLLLREGAPVYHGPRGEAAAYFGKLGFAAPAKDSGEDVADWLVNLVASPPKALAKGSTVNLSDSSKAPLTTKALKEAWKSSDLYDQSVTTKCAANGKDVRLTTDFAKKQYGVKFPHSFTVHFLSVLKRQAQVTIRNKLFMSARIGAAVFTSLILGSVWFDLPPERGFEKLGMLLFCVLHISFSNFSELTFSVEQKYVAYKHLDNKMFPGVAYIAAWGMVHLPIALAETLVFSAVLYPMVGLAMNAGNWFFFYLNLVLANVAMASFFRIVALAAPDMEAAQTFPGPVIAVFIIFAGFLITPSKMGFLKFVYYISLFAYSLRSLCQNEFLSDTYDAQVAINPVVQIEYLLQNPNMSSVPVATLCADGAFECTTMGKAIMSQIQIDDDTRWLWGGAFFCLGFFALTFYGSVKTLEKVRIIMNIGSSRAGTDEEAEREAREVVVAINPVKSSASASDATLSTEGKDLAQHAVKFVPMSIAWQNLEYTVNIAAEAGGGSKQLLQSVTSAARPNRMLALMGASGAGKTTLLDVIAGRKTGGVRKGTITLNGHSVEKETFARCTAYCEQMDLHNEFATVNEALEFSAKLRLGEGTTAEARHGFVSEALDILELRPLAGRMIGSSGSSNGLSPGQRKVLTVAVELVSNAPVFFLDEPTSGLDSRAALIVMTEVKKVATMGRTVISTIHQPSREIFLMFDDLLLLQRGGWQVYFGPLGANKASEFVGYMESLPSVQQDKNKLPLGMNPASWMLDILGGTDSSNAGGADGDSKATGVLLDGLELETHFKNSDAGKAASTLVSDLSSPEAGSEMFKFSSPYARSFSTQLRTILYRSHLAQLRDVGYNCGRIGVLTVLYILFGVIYVDLDTSDEGGVQSMVSVVFMTTIFTGIICMNAVMPVRVRERAVSFRERSSFMYDGIPYAISHALIEIPWVALIALVTVTPLYFLVGMVPTGESFFFHVLINVLVSYSFLSVGQAVACMCTTIQTAQAGTSAFIPIAFLFGGLYLPLPQIPVYWKWAYYINPVAFAIQSVVAPQFQRRDCAEYDGVTATSNDCPTIVAFRGTYFETIDTLAFVEDKYDVTYSGRWLPAIWLLIFCLGAQSMHVAAAKFVNTVNR